MAILPPECVTQTQPHIVLNAPSIDSSTTATTPTVNIQNMLANPDFPPRASSASPQQRKMSEFSQDLLNPGTFHRVNPNTGTGSSSRLFKKIEEMMDLSSPYNHYRCLSPSESNLLQYGGSINLHNLSCMGGNLNIPQSSMMMLPFGSNSYQQQVTPSAGDNSRGSDAILTTQKSVTDHTSSAANCCVPGSGRLLRRQFSLDKDDTSSSSVRNANNNGSISNKLANTASRPMSKQNIIFGDPEHSSMPSINQQMPPPSLANKIQQQTARALGKQNSSSISQDLEKIEESPLSPRQPTPLAESHGDSVRGGNGGPSTQSSLSNSIPFIDSGGSCSSSVSMIPNTMATQHIGPWANVSGSQMSDSVCDTIEISANAESMRQQQNR